MAPDRDRIYAPDIRDLGDRLAALSTAQAAALGAYLRRHYGIEPVTAAINVVPTDHKVPPPQPAPSSFRVVLEGLQSPLQKIGVIRAARELLGLSIKEARDLVDGAPKPIKENISSEEAESVKKTLEEAGAVVSVQPM